MTESYRKWWEAFCALGKKRGRGWLTNLAEKLGYSYKHISLVRSGKAIASTALQEEIARFFGVPYHKMIEYGADILEGLEKEKMLFPRYNEVMSFPKEKRFDLIVQIAKETTGVTLVAYDPEDRKAYERGEISEVELYRRVSQHMKTVAEAIEKMRKLKELMEGSAI